MGKWVGAAGVCVNDQGQLLMVLQGKSDEPKRWSVPSGGREKGESFEECCIRELREETGYEVEILRRLHEKRGVTFGYEVTVKYFEVQQVGGAMKIQDPDELIHEIAWKSIDEIKQLDLSFPEDLDFLLEFVQSKESKSNGI